MNDELEVLGFWTWFLFKTENQRKEYVNNNPEYFKYIREKSDYLANGYKNKTKKD